MQHRTAMKVESISKRRQDIEEARRTGAVDFDKLTPKEKILKRKELQEERRKLELKMAAVGGAVVVVQMCVNQWQAP